VSRLQAALEGERRGETDTLDCYGSLFVYRDVAWSYSRSQAHHPQQVGVTSPSFTERRWAGPSTNIPGGTDDDTEDEEEDYEAYLEGDSDHTEDVEEEDLEDDLDEFGVPHPPHTHSHSRGRSASRDRRRSPRASSSRRSSSPSTSTSSRQHRPRRSRQVSPDERNGTRSPTRPVASTTSSTRRLQDRQVSRLAQESRDTDERSRSRSRSPKRVAASSNVYLPDAPSLLGRRADSHGGSARGRVPRQSKDGPRLQSGVSDFPRVGSHYERYSIRSSSKDDTDRASYSPEMGEQPVIYRTDENTPLLLSLHRSKSAEPTMEGYSGRSERGRSRSTIVLNPAESLERTRIPSLERSPTKARKAADAWWDWVLHYVERLAPCCGRRR
jgi:hypothetical protein